MNTRQVNILRELLVRDGYVPAQELANSYGISTKTTYSDLAAINDSLAFLQVSIEKKPRNGVRLLLTPSQKRAISDFLESAQHQQVEEATPFQRECELVQELILGQGLIDILDWSISHFISETSIRRDLERLEQQLATYQILLDRKSGRISLKGKEENIRKFFRNYLIEHNNLNLTDASDLNLGQFFSLLDISQVLHIVDTLAETYHFNISEQYRAYLILDLLISSHRYKAGLILSEEPASVWREDISHYEVYIIASELLSQVTGTLMPLLPDSEIRYICYTLLSVGYETKIVRDPQMEGVVSQFIERVSQLSSVDFSIDNHLYQMLINHIQPMIYRIKAGINIKNQLTEDIKTRYSVLYHMVWIGSKVLSETFQVALKDAEIAFLTIYFEVAVEKMTKPLTIYVICPHGLATSELILSSLRRTISSFDHLINLDFKGLTPEKLAQADLVISSITLDDLSIDYIKVSPILTDQELSLIQQTYTGMIKGNRHFLSAIRDNDVFSKSVVLDLLADRIILQAPCKTIEEAIARMVEETSLANRSNTGFVQSIIDREQLGSTSMYTGIALPHADPTVVKTSELVVMTLEKPIEWGQNRVSLIMLIAVAEEDEQLYKKALIGLYSKIDRKDYIDQLVEASSKEAFRENL